MHEFSGNSSAIRTGRSRGIRVHSILCGKAPKEGNNPFSHYSRRVEEGPSEEEGKGELINRVMEVVQGVIARLNGIVRKAGALL